MSVYIKGMETPKNCDDCPLCEQRDYYSSPYCRVSDDDDMMSINEIRAKRRDNCPLIPVPYHRRLIDADALASMYDPNADFGKSVRDMIEDCPTIIPADKEGE